MTAPVVEIRLSWRDAVAFRTDLDLRRWLQGQGLDTRAMSCRRDNTLRQFVYSGVAAPADAAEVLP